MLAGMQLGLVALQVALPSSSTFSSGNRNISPLHCVIAAVISSCIRKLLPCPRHTTTASTHATADISMSVADREPGSLPYASHENMSMQVPAPCKLEPFPTIEHRLHLLAASHSCCCAERDTKNSNVACGRGELQRLHQPLQGQDRCHACRCVSLPHHASFHLRV